MAEVGVDAILEGVNTHIMNGIFDEIKRDYVVMQTCVQALNTVMISWIQQDLHSFLRESDEESEPMAAKPDLYTQFLIPHSIKPSIEACKIPSDPLDFLELRKGSPLTPGER